MLDMQEREGGNESLKLLNFIRPYLNGKGIDIGCGPWPLEYSNIDTVDGNPEFNPTFCCSAVNIPVQNNYYDFVYSSHCLEHIKSPKNALNEWIRILKPGGLLILHLPHKYFYPNVRDKEGNAAHWFDFTPDDIIHLLYKINGTYTISVVTFAEHVTPRWEKIVSYPSKKEFNQYSFCVIASKYKKNIISIRCLESSFNKLCIYYRAIKFKITQLIKK